MNTFLQSQRYLNAKPTLQHSMAHHLINGLIPFLFFGKSDTVERIQTYQQSGEQDLFQDKS